MQPRVLAGLPGGPGSSVSESVLVTVGHVESCALNYNYLARFALCLLLLLSRLSAVLDRIEETHTQ
jgi:hypothetical protein